MASDDAMQALLDTHLLLWWLEDSERLSVAAHAIIANRANTLYFSPVSVWEVAVKRALNRLDFRYDAALFRLGLLAEPFDELPFTSLHALGVSRLPLVHRDPFDRMLLAQALQENLTLVTSDKLVASYPGNIILV